VGAGLFLALWWASHFRRVRRARKLVELGAATGQSAQPMVEKPTQAEGADA